MKAFTAKLARLKPIPIWLRKEIILLAYQQLIAEHLDSIKVGEAEFTQGALSGRIHYLGLWRDLHVLMAEGIINQEKEFEKYWSIFTHPGFYTELNSHAIIRFTEK